MFPFRKTGKSVAVALCAVAGALGVYLWAFGAYHWYCGHLMQTGAFPHYRVITMANFVFDPLFRYQDSDHPGSGMLSYWSEWCAWKGIGSPRLRIEEQVE
ncbi:MAG: hypothetical protein U0992_18345 [Planctomycetaceae bacterium]